jgi:hypothetical protein
MIDIYNNYSLTLALSCTRIIYKYLDVGKGRWGHGRVILLKNKKTVYSHEYKARMINPIKIKMLAVGITLSDPEDIHETN